MLISHVYNEEFMLHYWIRHHAPLFDHAVIIDYNSTDGTREILAREAPPSWRVITSSDKTFSPRGNDLQVMQAELQYPDHWHLALTTSEFLVHPDWRGALERMKVPMNLRTGRPAQLRRLPAFIMVGDDTQPLMPFTSLVTQRSVYAHCLSTKKRQEWHQCHELPPGPGYTPYARFFHTGFTEGTYHYRAGRHSIAALTPSTKHCSSRDIMNFAENPEKGSECLVNTDVELQSNVWYLEGVILKYKWTPWPESITRTLSTDWKRAEASQCSGNVGIQNAGRNCTLSAADISVLFPAAGGLRASTEKRRNISLKNMYNRFGDLSNPRPYDLEDKRDHYMYRMSMIYSGLNRLHRVFHEAGFAKKPIFGYPSRPSLSCCSNSFAYRK